MMNCHDPQARSSEATGDIERAAREACGPLGRILREGVDIHRCQAAQALGRIGHPSAAAPLIEALLDEDEDVRTDAAAALSRLAGSGIECGAGPHLLENLLGDPCTDVKLAAIDALTRLKEQQVVPWLRRLVRGPDQEIAWDHTDFFESGWDDWVDVQIKAIDSLAELGDAEAVPEILEAMADEDAQDLSETVFKALPRFGDTGVAALVDFLDDQDERRRRRAARALGDIDGATAADALRRAFEHSDPAVRLAALAALAERDPSDERLTAAFDDDSPEVRSAAVRLCGRFHPHRVRALVDDQAPEVQKTVLDTAAELPGLCEDDEFVSALQSNLDVSDPQLAAAAAIALAAGLRQKALDSLTTVLADADRPVEARIGALRGLLRIGGDVASVAIIDVIADDQRPLRIEAMTALARLAGTGQSWPDPAAAALLAALRGELTTDETAAAVVDRPEPDQPEPDEPDDAEAVTEPENAFPTSTLDSILGEKDQAIDSLGLPEKGVELTPADMERLALAKRIKGKRTLPVVPRVAPHQDVRRFSARVLGDVARPEIAEELATALVDDDNEVRTAAADSLARLAACVDDLPEPVIDRLSATLSDADRNLRMCAVRALGGIGAAKAVGALIGRLDDDDSFVRTEAIQALSKMSEVGPGIDRLLGDADPAVRLAAADAIAGAGGKDALERLVDFAFAFEGYHRRETGRLLRGLGVEAASMRFIEVLGDDAQIRNWPVAIEALEELNRSRRATDERDTHDTD